MYVGRGARGIRGGVATMREVGHDSIVYEKESSLGYVCKQNMLAQCPTSITVACGHRSLLRAIDRAEDH